MWKMVQKKFDSPGSETDVETKYWYDKKGRRWKTEVTREYQTIATTVVFDELDRVESVTDSLGNKIEYTYDENGNVLTVTETEYPGETVYTTTNAYDNLDRLISSTNWNGTTLYKYDSRNNLKQITDKENHVTRKNFDAMGRLIENIYELSSGNISVRYGLDKNGRLISQTDDNGNITSYGYDNANHRTSETLLGGSHKTYFFNQYGALDGMIDNNGTGISYTYNAAFRITQKDIYRATGVEGTTKETFVYDGIGQITEAKNYITDTQISQVAMTYDSLGNKLTETQNGKTVTSQYDVLSFRTSVDYPGDTTITLVPDDLNRIDQIKEGSDIIADYSYAGPYRVTSRAYNNGNGPALSVEYDGGRRATSYLHTYSSTTITGFAYHFDSMNNKLYEHRWNENKGEAFKYDEIYRLTGVKYEVTNLSPSLTYNDYSGDTEELYTLDGVGNRTQVADGVVTTTYTANTLNQYETISNTELTNLEYDDNGNVISDTTNTYGYDYANRLLNITRQSDSRVLGEYKYDTLGRRIWKSAWSDDTQTYTETYFYYDGSRCIEERNSGDTVIATYVFGNRIDEVLTMERDSQTYYYHENSLGSIYAVTTGTGNVVERYLYNAYGEVTFLDALGNQIVSSTIGNRILFTGRELDSETELYYYRARYYSAEQGRFLSRDAEEDDSLLNLYAYVENNSVNYLDPWGYERVAQLTPEKIAQAIKKAKERSKKYIKYGTDLASRLLQHFAEGSGSVFHLTDSDIKKIMNTTQAQQAIDAIERNFKSYLMGLSLAPGESKEIHYFSDDVKATYFKPTTILDFSAEADLFYSFHNLYFRGMFTGIATRSKKGCKITFDGNSNFHIHDSYRFANRPWSAIPGEPDATDDLFWIWQTYGDAKAFEVTGVYTKDNVKIEQDYSVANKPEKDDKSSKY